MIHKNINRAEYDALEGINFSKLKHFRDSRNKGAFELSNFKKTPAMVLSTAIHILALEPQNFERQFIIGGPINPKTGETYGRSTKAFADWLIENGRDMSEVLSEEDYRDAAEIAERARNAVAINKSDLFEFALTWKDEKSGEACKCLVDFAQNGNYIGDLKTIYSALSEDNLSREIYMRQYYQQAAFYLDGARANKIIDFDKFFFTFVQKSDEKETISKLLGDESIEIGRAHNQQCLENFKLYRDGLRGGYKFKEAFLDIPNYIRNTYFNTDFFGGVE
jgi:hypothetical protein